MNGCPSRHSLKVLLFPAAGFPTQGILSPMRILLLILLALMVVRSAMACSLEMTTETLIGTSAGTVCANISNVKSDARGPFRLLDFDIRANDGGLEQFPAIPLRVGMSRPLRTLEIVGLGTVSLMVLKVKTQNLATLSFLNGNTINVQIDANGRARPDKICVQQVGVNQLRGTPGRCP